MEKYRVPRLVEWKTKRAARVLAGKDISAAAYEEDEGDEGDEGGEESIASGESGQINKDRNANGAHSEEGRGSMKSKDGAGSS